MIYFIDNINKKVYNLKDKKMELKKDDSYYVLLAKAVQNKVNNHEDLKNFLKINNVKSVNIYKSLVNSLGLGLSKTQIKKQEHEQFMIEVMKVVNQKKGIGK